MSPDSQPAQAAPDDGDRGRDKPGEMGDSGRDPGKSGQDDVVDEQFRKTRFTAMTVRLRELEARTEEASNAALARVEKRLPERLGARVGALRERIRQRPALDTAWRVGVFTLGSTLLVAGAIMFVIPGPGFATIILGLVVLASEFAWASRALDPVKAAAERAAESARDPRRRHMAFVAAAVLGVVAAVVAIWYLSHFGATLGPIYDLLREARSWAMGLFKR
ncbi:MAG: PGPGW domain-containing protein [Candidatus Nanopelagicales bacterium]